MGAIILLPIIGFATRVSVIAFQQSGDIHYGETVTGQVMADGSQDWHFIGVPGDRVGIHIVRASVDLVVGVTLQDADGQSLGTAQSADAGDLTLSGVPVAQPGAYTIHVFSLSHTAGSYQLTLTNTVTTTAVPTPIDQTAAGTIRYGQPVQGRLDGQTYEQFWRLTGTINDVIDVQMRVTSGDLASVVSLLSPAGDVITASAAQTQVASTSRDATIYAIQLASSGNYTILARRSGDQQGRTGTSSGTYTLTVTVHTVSPGAADSILTPGNTLTGRLTTTEPISQYRVETGGTLAFYLEFASLHRIARVRILDSGGTELFTRTGLSPLVFSLELPVKGPYFVQITSDRYDDQPGVDFALSAYKIGTVSLPLRYDQVQHGLTAAENTPDRWFFVGHAGDLVRLHLTPDTDTLSARLTFTGPQASGLFSGAIGPAFDQPFTLSADGAYQIAIQNATPYNYQLTVELFGAQGVSFTRAGVTGSKGVLAFDTPVSGTLARSSDDTYTLDAVDGQSLNITVTGQTAAQPLGVLIRAPDESLVAAQVGTGFVQLRQAILPVNGRYAVIVFDPSGAASSPYTLQLEDAGGGNLTAEQSVKGVLLPSDSLAEWSLDAQAGATLNARLTTRTPAAWTPGLYVVDPTGFVLAHSASSLDQVALDISGVRAPITGRYRFVVAGTVAAAFASYELVADTQIPFAAGSTLAVPNATPPPVARFAPVPGTPVPAPALAELIDPALPLDTSPDAVQPLPLNTLARGEIGAGALRQIWRIVSAGGVTLSIRAVALDAMPDGTVYGPDLALFDGSTGHIVAEQLHGHTPDTTLTYYSAQGGPYLLTARLQLGSGRYTVYATAQSLMQGALQVKQGLPLVYGQTTFGELLTSDQMDTYYFYGVANDVINLSAGRVTGNLSPGLACTSPSGQLLSADTNSASSANAALISIRLPETGIYAVQIRHADSASHTVGRYVLSIDLVSGSRIKYRHGGVLAQGQSVIGALLLSDSQNIWLLAGHTGDQVTLVASGLSAMDAPTPLSLQLQDTAGHPFAQADIQLPQDTARLSDVLLPADGIYRVQVTGGGQTQGGYRLTWLPDSASGHVSGALRYGQSISGLFTATHRADKYTFAGTTGDVIALSLRDVRGDPFRGGFQLLSAGGVALATAVDLGNGEGARIDGLTLPLTGAYTVVVANPDTGYKGTGIYTLSLTLQDSKARSMGGLLRDGDHSSGELYPDNPLNTWLFSGHGGDVITAHVVAGDHFLQPDVTLQTTSGEALAHAVGDANGQATITSFKLPSDGVYALAVAGANHTVGSYQIALTFAAPPLPALATISYGNVAVGLIADDRPTDLYLFNGRQGDKVSIKATRESGSALALTLELKGGAGDLLAQADALDGDNVTLPDFVLPETGTYQIVVSRFGGAAGRTAGRLTVALNGEPANFPVHGKVIPGQKALGRLDDATPADRWTFDGKSGQVISLTSKATSGDLDTFLTLQAPDGSVVAKNDDYDGTNAVLPGVVLQMDGTYTVILSRVGTRGHGSAGNYELQLDTLFTLSATATPQAAIGYGQRVTGTLDAAHALANWTFAAEQGDEISVLLVHPTDDAPPFLSIQDLSGTVLVSGALHVGQTTIDSYRLPTRGLFNVSVKRPLNAHAAYSPYALTLNLLRSTLDTAVTSGGPLPANSSVIGNMNGARGTTVWLLQADGGQTLGLTLTPLTANLSGTLQLVDPGGRTLVTQPLPTHGTPLTLTDIALPIGGLYAVLVAPDNADQSGTYRLATTLSTSAASGVYMIAPDETVQGTLSDLRPFDRWVFHASANQTLSAELLVTNGTLQPVLQLIGPTGQLLASSHLDQTPLGLVAAIDTVSLPATGDYQWIAQRSGSGSTAGSYTLSFGVGALATETLAALPIHYGQLMQAVITPARAGLWAFTGQAGDAIDVIALPGNATADAPVLILSDAAGNILAHAEPIARETAISSFTLPAAGQYVVALTAAHASGYTLLVQRRQDTLPVTFTPRVLVKGTTLENGIQTGHLYDYWSFNAQHGDPGQIVISRLAGNLRLDVSLYGPNGYVAGKTADVQTGALTIGPLQFPVSGTYTVVIGRWLGASGKTSGRYTILWTSATLPLPTATPIPLNDAPPLFSVTSAIDAPLTLTDMGQAAIGSRDGYTATVGPQQIGHLWMFDAQRSPTIALSLSSESAGLQLSASIVDGNGHVIGHTQTDSSGVLALEVSLLLPGRYTLQIMPRAPGQIGTYRFQLAYALAPTGGGRLVSDELVTGALTNSHFTDDWRFDALQGAQITINANRTAGDLALAFALIGPDGTPVLSSDDQSNSNSAHNIVQAPAGGTYNLLISRQGGAASPTTGAYQLRVTITVPTF